MDEKTRKRLSTYSDRDLFANILGIKILERIDGFSRVEMPITEKSYNALGTIHGGCLYTLADIASGLASGIGTEAGPTIQGDMYFLRPIKDTEKLVCEASIVKHGHRIRVVESVIKDDKGIEVARSLMQYMYLEKNVVKSFKS